jgi:legumain
LRDHGVPQENIILFMNGNYANNEQNPFPGTLYTDKDRRRNYAVGLRIDYSGEDVTINNYLAVLRGDQDKVKGGTGRVLNRSATNFKLKEFHFSTKNDRVFVSHESHGTTGSLLIADENRFLDAKDLITTLKYMEEKQMFEELVYFIMACHSGSMFDGHLDSNGKSK